MIDVAYYKPERRIPPPLWRECIKKVWEVDPLIYLRCQTKMKIISFIVEQKVILRILAHLKLWPGNGTRGSAFWPGKLGVSSTHSGQERHYESIDVGWPGYDELIYGSDGWLMMIKGTFLCIVAGSGGILSKYTKLMEYWMNPCDDLLMLLF